MNIPENLLYSKDHEWLRIDGDMAYVGITAYAVDQLGDIVFIDVNTVGETLDKDEVFGTVEAVKTVADLLLPMGGEIVEVNESAADVINADPYEQGWIVKLKYADIEESKELLDPAQYKKLLDE